MNYYIQTVVWHDGKLLQGRSAGNCSDAMSAKMVLKALHKVAQLLRRFGEKEGTNRTAEFILTVHRETQVCDYAYGGPYNGEMIDVPEIDAMVQTVKWVTPLRAARLLEAVRLTVMKYEGVV